MTASLTKFKFSTSSSRKIWKPLLIKKKRYRQFTDGVSPQCWRKDPCYIACKRYSDLLHTLHPKSVMTYTMRWFILFAQRSLATLLLKSAKLTWPACLVDQDFVVASSTPENSCLPWTMDWTYQYDESRWFRDILTVAWIYLILGSECIPRLIVLPRTHTSLMAIHNPYIITSFLLTIHWLARWIKCMQRLGHKSS